MDTFIRRFEVSSVIEHRANKALRALFDRWVLPGESADSYGLRLAIRNGYLNFYVKGQSVGELRTAAGSPRLKLHRKYTQLAKSGGATTSDLGQKYDIFNSDELNAIGSDIVDGWIRTAETYAGDEKRFVDDLVAVTPGTIDLEMGLPADEGSTGKDRTAPRMDLVVAQGSNITFWEAKCAVNGELRARAPYCETPEFEHVAGPHVLWQLRRYERWVGRPKRREEVRVAYLEAARLLLELAEGFGKSGPAIDAWRALVAAGNAASVILPPGIVVADYCPPRADGMLREEVAAYTAKTSSFAQHRQRLVDHGATIVSVRTKPDRPVLPPLTSGSISDKEKRA